MRTRYLAIALVTLVTMRVSDLAVAQGQPPSEKQGMAATWTDRAEPAARQYVLANAPQIANDIQRVAHPAGTRPELTNLDFSKVEDRLLARIAVAWSEAAARRGYAAWVYWEFGERGHVRAQIVSHTSPTRISAESARRIEDLFRENIYPAIQRAASAGN